ncbi:MAG: 50S ribosomal protein L29 [Nanoarchaeota archaeon]|nr:50S ribosomal protein L29 [Nanoarchaeota archaeon]
MMKAKKFRSMSKVERDEALAELRKELMRLKSQVKTGLTPDNPSRINHIQKSIAQILTVKEELE